MATLYIEEYDNMPRDANGQILPIVSVPLKVQKVTVAGTSAQSAAVKGSALFVRLISDTACQYEIAADPTAVATSMYLPANVPVDRKIVGGQKIAVISQQ